MIDSYNASLDPEFGQMLLVELKWGELTDKACLFSILQRRTVNNFIENKWRRS